MALVALVAIGLAGCDPVIDIDGSFFPAWMLCIVLGIALTIVSRKLLARLGLEPHLGPLPIVYPCLALLLTLGVWIAFFRS